MKTLYATLVSVPLLFGCGKAVESIDTKVEQTPLTSIPAAPPQTERPPLPPCDGAPDIQKLFQIYGSKSSNLLERGLTTPSIKRAYERAEVEMKTAREALALCRMQSDRSLYLTANQYAISAVNWIEEATQQQWAPILAKWEREKKK